MFEIFLCRDLGPDTNPRHVLHTDYNVDCDEISTLRWTLGPALVLLWPIGVPAVLFSLMFRVRTKIISGDEDVTNMFNFLVGDYKPKYWFWEVVELFRKLLLSGILSLVGRGSIAQAVLGTAISFAFFALHLTLLPYKSPTLNVIKAASEIQMFAVLQLSIVLQSHNVGFDSEVVSVDDYGVMQTVATVLIAPLAIYLIAYNVKGLLNVVEVDSETETETESESESKSHSDSDSDSVSDDTVREKDIVDANPLAQDVNDGETDTV